MACRHDWTIKFLHGEGEPFEARPITMSLKFPRKEYQFCRATFPEEVGKQMEPHTANENGKLYGYTPVDILYDGEQITRMVFRPDWADYARKRTHVQLHDLHKTLASGAVDIQKHVAKIKSVYKELIEQADNNFVTSLDDDNFQLPDDKRKWFDGEGFGTPLTTPKSERFIKDFFNAELGIDLEKVSAEKAIQRLNQIFNITSWFNNNGELIIGVPEVDEQQHIAAPNDDRVWRYKEVDVTHGREPVKKVLVEGKWIDEPGWGGFDEAAASIAGVFGGGGREGKDVKAFGVAERTDIDYGTIFAVKNTNVSKEKLPEVAKVALSERMKDKNDGTVEIDPGLSGTYESHPTEIKPGHRLRVIPDDKLYNQPTAESGNLFDAPDNPELACGNIIHNENYLVSEVEHNVNEGGGWNLFVDVGLISNPPVESRLEYYDPGNNDWIDDKTEIEGDGEYNTSIDEITDEWYEDI